MLVPVILLLVDLGAITIAAFQNDSICREACCAAASGDPKESQSIAQAELAKYNSPGGFSSYSLSGPPVVKIDGEVPDGGLVTGTVTVGTCAKVHALFIVGFFSPNITLTAEQSFPYTYTKPSPKESESESKQ